LSIHSAIALRGECRSNAENSNEDNDKLHGINFLRRRQQWGEENFREKQRKNSHLSGTRQMEDLFMQLKCTREIEIADVQVEPIQKIDSPIFRVCRLDDVSKIRNSRVD
jgi:hypothetical protein